MIPVLPYRMGLPIDLAGGRFSIGIVLYEYIFFFVDRTTGSWSTPSFTNAKCSSEDAPVDPLSTSLSLQNSVDFLYRDSI